MLVSTTNGKIQGFEKDGVVQFRGVPYAAPPVGPLRFRSPQPAASWDGVRDCTRYGASALQNLGGMEALAGGRGSSLPTSEDCLFLNLWTPAADDGGRPVMVWFHGGAFTSGSGSIPWYSGSRLATAGDVVVVTVNYRLGLFGFLHLAPLLGDEYVGSGNAGLLDQVAALGWVRDNIAAFGGDPQRITIFGESAGGMSVGTHLGSPRSRGLFQRAIPQSGTANVCVPATAAEALAQEALRVLDLDEATADALLTLAPERLLAAQEHVAPPGGSSLDGSRFLRLAPVIDGVVLPEPPLAAVAAGSADGVDVVVGTTRDECNLFLLMAQGEVDEPRMARAFERVFAGNAQHALDVYTANRPGASPRDVVSAMMTDRIFRQPAIRLAETLAAREAGRVWSYRFDWASTAFDGLLGACHALEIPFVFDNLDRKGVEFFLGPVDERARRLAHSMSRAWLGLATAGDPNHDDLPEWPEYDGARRSTMVLGDPSQLVDDPDGEERELWAAVR